MSPFFVLNALCPPFSLLSPFFASAMRHAVIWRRISGGTDSERGSRFVERMLTAVATCRQQGRNVLDYLRSCFEAARSGQAIPSLLPVAQPKIKIA